MTEGEVLTYFVEVGEEVSVDQPLLEIQTDKMVAELPSPVDGRITTIHYDIGEVVNVGEIILEIDDGKEKMMQQNVPEPLQGLDRDEKVGEVEKKEVVKQSVPSTAVLAAPYTRKIAREHQIDIEKLKGTGYDGRVLEKD